MNTTNTQSTQRAGSPSKVPAVINYLRRVERLLKKGWIKRQFHTEEGYCAIGAIVHHGQDDMVRREVMSLVGAEVGKRTCDGSTAIHRYNDAPTTTKADVLSLVRDAINVARRQYRV